MGVWGFGGLGFRVPKVYGSGCRIQGQEGVKVVLGCPSPVPAPNSALFCRQGRDSSQHDGAPPAKLVKEEASATQTCGKNRQQRRTPNPKPLTNKPHPAKEVRTTKNLNYRISGISMTPLSVKLVKPSFIASEPPTPEPKTKEPLFLQPQRC